MLRMVMLQDSSGAVLPGVTVEAASPALIERVLLVVTDSAGRYAIINLRPGTYVVTFTLSGFQRRAGIGSPPRGAPTTRTDRFKPTTFPTICASSSAKEIGTTLNGPRSVPPSMPTSACRPGRRASIRACPAALTGKRP